MDLLDSILHPCCLQSGLRVLLLGVLVKALYLCIAVGIEHPHGTLLDLSRIERGHKGAALRNAGHNAIPQNRGNARIGRNPVNHARVNVPKLLAEREFLTDLQNDASHHFQRATVIDSHITGSRFAANHNSDRRRTGSNRNNITVHVNKDGGRIAGRPDDGTCASAVLQRIRQIERLADLKIEQRLELIDRNIGL